MKKLFIDMDGVLAEYKKDCTENDLMQRGYFSSLAPQENMLKALSMLVNSAESIGIGVYVLTKVYPSTFKFSISEKLCWRDANMPYLFDSEFIMVNGDVEEKSEAIAALLGEELNPDCYLLDDYNRNLDEWRSSGGSAIKFVNHIDDKNHSFVGNRIRYDMTAAEIFNALLEILCLPLPAAA